MKQVCQPQHTDLSQDTSDSVVRQPCMCHESLESDELGRQVTAYIRRVIQQQCSEAISEYQRSAPALSGANLEVDVGVSYPVKCREEFEAALDALGQHWPIREATELPIYLMVLQWSGRICYVHIYDKGETVANSHADHSSAIQEGEHVTTTSRTESGGSHDYTTTTAMAGRSGDQRSRSDRAHPTDAGGPGAARIDSILGGAPGRTRLEGGDPGITICVTAQAAPN